MIRSELVQKLCGDFPDLTQREIELVVTALFDSITEQLDFALRQIRKVPAQFLDEFGPDHSKCSPPGSA